MYILIFKLFQASMAGMSPSTKLILHQSCGAKTARSQHHTLNRRAPEQTDKEFGAIGLHTDVWNS